MILNVYVEKLGFRLFKNILNLSFLKRYTDSHQLLLINMKIMPKFGNGDCKVSKIKDLLCENIAKISY